MKRVPRLLCLECGEECSYGVKGFCSYKCRAESRRRRGVRICFNTGCHEWLGNRSPRGYALTSINNKTKRLGRVIWERLNGSIPKGHYVCHTCDNPPCINPGHLFLGTTQENTADRHHKGRSVRGSKMYCAKLTEEDIINIRASALSVHELMFRYGVSRSTIERILQRKRWKHVF